MQALDVCTCVSSHLCPGPWADCTSLLSFTLSFELYHERKLNSLLVMCP